MKDASDSEQLAVIEALVALSAADLPYSDLYLNRAEALLADVFTHEQYLPLRRERDRLPGLARELRSVAESGNWEQVRTLAQQGVYGQQRISDHQRLLLLGDAVYGPRVLHADATALALSGIMVQPTSHLGRVRDDCIARLRFVLAHDVASAALYTARLAHLAGLEIVADEAAGLLPNAADLRQRVLEAADQGDFQQADRLSAAIIDAGSRNVSGRLRAPRASDGRMQMLASTFSDATGLLARDLGMSAVTLASDEALDGYLGCLGESQAAVPGQVGPATVSTGLRETLDLLMRLPFVTSAGSRYFPWFGAETLLVETFPETEPETRTGLLDALGLPNRRAMSRLAIEDAVRTRSTRLCANLGLDAAAYAVVPIPFDAYLRLAPRFAWGRQHLWTHFDGYQLTPELHLRALVGGDAHYGGPEDLCSVPRDYETERLVARFAIVHRHRLTPHAPEIG